MNEDEPRAQLSQSMRLPRASAFRTVAAAAAVAFVGCGGNGAPAEEPREPVPLAADVPELEIRGGADGVDRFTTCPPPGELGQHWIPTIPPWTPPAKTGFEPAAAA